MRSTPGWSLGSRCRFVPRTTIAKASKKSLGTRGEDDGAVRDVDEDPEVGDALGDGAITADHVDAVTRASKKLDAANTTRVVERADALAEVAKAGTVEQFTRRLDLETKRLQEATASTV